MADDERQSATAAEAATYVATVVLGLAMALEPCGCDREDCMDGVTQHPGVQGALLHHLGALVAAACAGDERLAALTGTTPARTHPAGVAAWTDRCRKALAELYGEDDVLDRARQEQLATVWALATKLGGTVCFTPREVLDAGELGRTVTTWHDAARDVYVVKAEVAPDA